MACARLLATRVAGVPRVKIRIFMQILRTIFRFDLFIQPLIVEDGQ